MPSGNPGPSGRVANFFAALRSISAATAGPAAIPATIEATSTPATMPYFMLILPWFDRPVLAGQHACIVAVAAGGRPRALPRDASMLFRSTAQGQARSVAKCRGIRLGPAPE